MAKAPNNVNTGGTYALLLHLSQPAHLEVGRLGQVLLPSGYYLYLGSALAGLKARLARHLRWSVEEGSRPPLRWHIDYLLAQTDVVELWWQNGRERQECAWAALAQVAPGANLPVPGFGSSDCRCPSHLLHFLARPRADILKGANISALEVATRRPGPRADRAVRPYRPTAVSARFSAITAMNETTSRPAPCPPSSP